MLAGILRFFRAVPSGLIKDLDGAGACGATLVAISSR